MEQEKQLKHEAQDNTNITSSKQRKKQKYTAEPFLVDQNSKARVPVIPSFLSTSVSHDNQSQTKSRTHSTKRHNENNSIIPSSLNSTSSSRGRTPVAQSSRPRSKQNRETHNNLLPSLSPSRGKSASKKTSQKKRVSSTTRSSSSLSNSQTTKRSGRGKNIQNMRSIRPQNARSKKDV